MPPLCGIGFGMAGAGIALVPVDGAVGVGAMGFGSNGVMAIGLRSGAIGSGTELWPSAGAESETEVSTAETAALAKNLE